MKLNPVVTALSTVVVLWSAAAQAAPSYSITALNINTLGTSIRAMDINASGQVVGSFRPSGFGSNSHAFLYNGSAIIDLGTFGGQDSTAYAINDNGQVVGYSDTTPGSGCDFGCTRAFLYSGGVMADLGTLGGNHSAAFGINARGQVVGYALTTGNFGLHAFLYDGGTMTDLGTLGSSSTGSSSTARAINDSGQVAGDSGTSAGHHAFLYNGGVMTDIGSLGGQIDGHTEVTGINASGQVVGYSTPAAGTGIYHAFLYSGDTMTDLGTLGGSYTESQASGINDNGQVVGNSHPSGGIGHAFLYSGGTMTDLNNLIDPLSGWTITNANAINNSGQIAGHGCKAFGNDCTVVLLTPVPEPEIYIMMLAGLGLIGGMARRWKNLRP